MPKSDPSERTRELYQAIAEQFEGVPVVSPPEVRHGFNVKMESFDTEQDEVEMMGDNFPYIRSALIDEAVARGDIKQEQVVFADDATLTIDGEEYPIEDGSVTLTE